MPGLWQNCTMSAPSSPHLEDRLTHGLTQLGLVLDDRQRGLLVAYLLELERWNRAFNLTAVRAPAHMLTRHLLDCLAVLPWLRRGPVLDLGTGAGLPGVVLAIARPDLEFVLLDSSGKRIRFVRHVCLELGLPNVGVVQVRAEDYRPGDSFGTVVSRAFSALGQMLALSGPLLAEDGRVLAMKGAFPTSELAALTPGWRVAGVHLLQVPGLGARRHLVEIARRPAANRAEKV